MTLAQLSIHIKLPRTGLLPPVMLSIAASLHGADSEYLDPTRTSALLFLGREGLKPWERGAIFKPRPEGRGK